MKMKPLQKTPLQKYRALKEIFCSQFSNENAWGNNQISGQRLDAYNQLIIFLKQSEELVELDETFEGEISYENVKLLLGNDIRLPNSLKRSMRSSFISEPYENLNEKFYLLMSKLEYDERSLKNELINRSNSSDESDPFPFMRGLPTYAECCGQVDFGDVDPHADVDEFSDYLYENNLFSFCDDTVDSNAESMAESEASSMNESPSESSEIYSANAVCRTHFERFSARLRRLRWRIYQKIAAKSITKNDLDKYKILVGQFINKFGYRELSKSEVFLWKRKVLTTRNDALDAPFDDHLFKVDLSDASSQELSLVSLDKSDIVNVQKTRAKVDSVKELFENQRALEDLLDKLPSVPNAEDEEIKKRLNKLRGNYETNDS